MSDFLYALCNPGSEKFLKQEVALKFPELRFAYSRQGLVTFKNQGPAFKEELYFARVHGRSLGKVALKEVTAVLLNEKTSFCVHLYSLAQDQEMLSKIKEVLGPIRLNEAPKVGEEIFDIIHVSAEEIWLGRRQHRVPGSPFPGGDPQTPLPEEAPSRAYLKAAEAQQVFHLDFTPGQRVLELGCSPGGMSYYFLQQGLGVLGVDTGDVDEASLKKFGDFRFARVKSQSLDYDKIQSDIHWLAVDLNLAPKIVLPLISQAMDEKRKTLKGLIWNLKIKNVDTLSHFPHWIKELKSFGFKEVYLKQLVSNAQEITVFAR